MRRNRPESKMTRRRRRAEQPSRLACRQTNASPAALHRVDESSLTSMHPGDLILLDSAVAMRNSIDPVFFAVLACPLCGTPALITSAQYLGAVAIMCGSKDCCGLYRIVDQDRLMSLPVN
jgi:uncharacterized protein YbaR (Trm112 family)